MRGLATISAAALAVSLLAGCSGAAPAQDPTTQPGATNAPASSAAPEASGPQDVTTDFKKFLSVDYAGAPWLDNVTKAEIQTGAVWVHTNMPKDADSEAWGKSICTAARAYGFDKGIQRATSRAVDGQRLAMC